MVSCAFTHMIGVMSEQENNPRTPAPTIWPSLQAHDARALIDWLVATLGFEETAAYEEDGKIAHARNPQAGITVTDLYYSYNDPYPVAVRY